MKRFIAAAVSLVVLAVIVLAGWLVWGSWVSPLERRAMRVALDRIDEVARYEGSQKAVYDQKIEAAHEAILVCRKRRITAYDGQLVLVLDTQLTGAQAVHQARLRAATDQQYVHSLKVIEDSDQQTEAMLREHLQ